MRRKLVIAAVFLLPLALIAAGVWMIYPPASFITVGALLWFDLYTRDSKAPK